MYWRRRRRTVFAAVPLRTVELRTSPVTRLSVHQHFHHASHSRLVLSPSYSTVSSSTTHVSAPRITIADRIVVKRLLEARPVDTTNQASSPASVTGVSRVVPPESSRSHTVVASSADDGRQPAMSRSRLHRIHTVETQHLTTSRTRHDTTRVSRTSQVRETRWRQGIDVVRLDWRKTSQSPAHQGESAAVTGRSAATPVQTRTLVEAGTSTPALATPAPRRDGTAPVLTMDRSTLDRLADNVMQRIERRVRIERERRGL